jgi:hypothetical protein
MHGMNEKSLYYFGRKTPKRRSHLEGLDVSGRIILKWILNGCVLGWIDPLQEKDQ